MEKEGEDEVREDEGEVEDEEETLAGDIEGTKLLKAKWILRKLVSFKFAQLRVVGNLLRHTVVWTPFERSLSIPRNFVWQPAAEMIVQSRF